MVKLPQIPTLLSNAAPPTTRNAAEGAGQAVKLRGVGLVKLIRPSAIIEPPNTLP